MEVDVDLFVIVVGVGVINEMFIAFFVQVSCGFTVAASHGIIFGLAAERESFGGPSIVAVPSLGSTAGGITFLVTDTKTN